MIYIASNFDLHFCRWQYGSTFISFHVIMLQSRTLWI